VDASFEEIHRAHRTLAMRYHPDRNPTPESEARMASVNEAYEVLRHPVRRREYDAMFLRPAVGEELAASILDAARDTILRGGWRVLEDSQKSLLLEKQGQRLRLLFMSRLSRATAARIQQKYGDRTVVLAVEIETPVTAGAQVSIVDLMRARRHSSEDFGFDRPADVALRSLLAPFLRFKS
jgi:hypothetical protein